MYRKKDTFFVAFLGSKIEESSHESQEVLEILPINEKSGVVQASESPLSVTSPEEDKSEEAHMVLENNEMEEILESLPENNSSEVSQASGNPGSQNSTIVLHSIYESDVDNVEFKEETIDEKSNENDRETTIKLAMEKLRAELLEQRINQS